MDFIIRPFEAYLRTSKPRIFRRFTRPLFRFVPLVIRLTRILVNAYSVSSQDRLEVGSPPVHTLGTSASYRMMSESLNLVCSHLIAGFRIVRLTFSLASASGVANCNSGCTCRSKQSLKAPAGSYEAAPQVLLRLQHGLNLRLSSPLQVPDIAEKVVDVFQYLLIF